MSSSSTSGRLGPRGWLPLGTFLAALTLALTLAAPLPSPACGPYFPNRVLLDGDRFVLSAPFTHFSLALERIVWGRPLEPDEREERPAPEPREETAAADLDDLARALAASGHPLERAKEILWQYDSLRRALAPRPAFPALVVPDGLPREFEEYIRGAVVFPLGEVEAACRLWEAILELPREERRYRSTWAAFMLGKARMRAHPERAVAWFERTRELADEGCEDTLQLAASSLGWEGKTELARGRHTRAIKLYLEHFASGDPTARLSVIIAVSRLLERGAGKPEVLLEAARHPVVRRVVTAALTSGVSRRDDKRAASAWLEAVEEAGVNDLDEAPLLAWASYQAGEMDLARRWLARAPQAPLALWLGAKLLLRDGDIDGAAALLAEALRFLPAGETWPSLSRGDKGLFGYLSPQARARAELGAIELSRREFVTALDCLLRSEHLLDAAYVAERVLTLDELLAYVERDWPEGARPETTFEYGNEPLAGDAVRFWLARRLARDGRLAEARRFYPKALRPTLDEYALALAAGHDESLPAEERGRALWRAALIARKDGLDLLGTEIEPDWTSLRGEFELDPSTGARAAPEPGSILIPSADEVERAARHVSAPEARFHYRYTASDLAWSAAELLPDGSEELARLLTTAGSWLKARDPQGADRFYKALVRRSGNTELGREADRLRWFPLVPEEP
jgi:tetratricopeptide (TPR) repeat protein